MERRRRQDRLAQYEGRTYRELLERLAQNTRAVRLRQGLSQEEAAARAEMATQLYQRIEGAASNLTLTTIARLCDGLDVDPAQLFRAPKGEAKPALAAERKPRYVARRRGKG